MIFAFHAGKFCLFSTFVLDFSTNFLFFQIFSSSDLKTCSKCHHMFYCNENCQKWDWINHKNECKFYKGQCKFFRNDIARLLLRVHLSLKRFPQKRTQLFKVPGTEKFLLKEDETLQDKMEIVEEISPDLKPEYRSYNDLRTPKKEVKKNKDTFKLFKTFFDGFRGAGLDVDREELFEDFCKIVANCTIFSTIYHVQIALSIFVPGFVHSCAPNACLSKIGRTVQIRALKKISPGEEITISLLSNCPNDHDIFSRQDRQKILKEFYYFKCSCPRCMDKDADKGKFVHFELFLPNYNNFFFVFFF